MSYDRLLLDTPSLFYRAFFALPKTITDKDGLAVNAVRGVLDMTASLILKLDCKNVVATFDANWRPDVRVKAYAGYKAARPDDPPELPPQLPILQEALDAAGITRVEATDLEADDALATLVTQKPDSERVAIVTGDRDLLCLVRDPDVTLHFPVKGVKEMKVFDEAEVERAHGVPPRLYPDYAILRGDSSDGLPGVRGIGPVKAASLLKRYGSIDAILEARGPAGDQARGLQRSAEYLTAAKAVVTLVRIAPLEVTEPGSPDVAALERLAIRHNLESPARRLLEALGHTDRVDGGSR